MQLLSMQAFSKVMELVGDEGQEPLRTIVSQSLLPLLLHWHDENVLVAEVRFSVMLPHPWEGARPPPAPGCAGLCFLCGPGAAGAEPGELPGTRAGSVASTFQPKPFSPAPPWPWQEPAGTALAGGFPWIPSICLRTVALFLCLPALQALREQESPSCMSILLQLTFQRRCAGLRSSAGAEGPAPASSSDFQVPLKMAAPAEQKGPAGAPGTALATHS